MSGTDKTKTFLDKLKPCIEKGELDACVDEAVKLAKEMGIGAQELSKLSFDIGATELHAFTYIMALAAAQGLKGKEKVTAHYNAGIAANSLGKMELSEEQYKFAIEENPKYTEAHNNYANLLNKLNRLDEAEEHYKLAIKANPKYTNAHFNYAILLQELKRLKEAEEQYRLTIETYEKTDEETDPKLAKLHSNYAIILKKLKRLEEAEEHYKIAIKADPKNAAILSNYAIILKELNRPEEAEEHYKLAIVADSKYWKAHNNYANLLREKAMFSEAEKEVRIALQIEINDPYALGTYGDILADEDYLEEAIKKYKEAIKNSDSMASPVVAEIRNNLGWAYAHLGQYDRANKEFEKANELDPVNVKAIRNLRAIRKVKSKTVTSKTQKWTGCGLFILVISTWYLFLNEKISENVFAAQSTILIAILIFILFYHQLDRFKAGPIEFEKSTEHRSQPAETLSKMERF